MLIKEETVKKSNNDHRHIQGPPNLCSKDVVYHIDKTWKYCFENLRVMTVIILSVFGGSVLVLHITLSYIVTGGAIKHEH